MKVLQLLCITIPLTWVEQNFLNFSMSSQSPWIMSWFTVNSGCNTSWMIWHSTWTTGLKIGHAYTCLQVSMKLMIVQEHGGGVSSDRLIPRNKTMIAKSIMSGTFVFRMNSKCRLWIVCHQIFIPVSFDFGIWLSTMSILYLI